MKDINCITCDTPNLVDIAEAFKCGSCGYINSAIDIETLYDDYIHLQKAYSDLADRLKQKDDEIWELIKGNDR
jgi:hypothetical protein